MQFGILILISRSVSIEEFGSYSALLGIGAVLSGILGWGLITRALRLRGEATTNLAAPFLMVTILSSCVACVVVFAWGAVGAGAIPSWVVAAALFVASEMVNNVVQSLLFGQLMQRRAEAAIVLRRAIPILVVGIGAVFWPAKIFEASAIGYLLSSVVTVSLLGKLQWGGWHLREVFVGSRQYWFSNIWSMLQQLDVTIVNGVAGAQAAGAYGAAFRFASPIHLVTSSLTSLMVPRLSGKTSTMARSAASRPFMRAALAYAALIAVVSPLAAYIGPFLFGEEYATFGVVFAIFFVNSALSVLNQTQAALLYAEGMARSVTYSIAIGTILGLGLAGLGAWLGGVVFAAAGYALSRAVLSLILFVRWRSRLREARNNGEV